MASPPNMGSLIIAIEPNMIAKAVKIMGLNLTAPDSIIEYERDRPRSLWFLIKSIKSKEFLITIPAKAITPIIDVAVNGCFNNQ